MIRILTSARSGAGIQLLLQCINRYSMYYYVPVWSRLRQNLIFCQDSHIEYLVVKQMYLVVKQMFQAKFNLVLASARLKNTGKTYQYTIYLRCKSLSFRIWISYLFIPRIFDSLKWIFSTTICQFCNMVPVFLCFCNI